MNVLFFVLSFLCFVCGALERMAVLSNPKMVMRFYLAALGFFTLGIVLS